MLFLQTDQGMIFPFNTNLPYDNSDGNRPGKVRMVQNSDGTFQYQVWAKNGTGGALTAKRPYMLSDGTTKADPLVVTVPATAAFYRLCVIATEATPNGEYGWFSFAGWVPDVQVTATAIAVGDPLEVINAGTTLIEDTGGGSVGTVGFATEANSAGGAQSVDIFMPGRPVQVAAS